MEMGTVIVDKEELKDVLRKAVNKGFAYGVIMSSVIWLVVTAFLIAAFKGTS